MDLGWSNIVQPYAGNVFANHAFRLLTLRIPSSRLHQKKFPKLLVQGTWLFMLDRRQTPCQKLPGTYRVGRTHSMLTCQQRFSYTRLLSHPNAYLTPVIHASRHQHCEIPVLDASWHQRYEHTPLEANLGDLEQKHAVAKCVHDNHGEIWR